MDYSDDDNIDIKEMIRSCLQVEDAASVIKTGKSTNLYTNQKPSKLLTKVIATSDQ